MSLLVSLCFLEVLFACLEKGALFHWHLYKLSLCLIYADRPMMVHVGYGMLGVPNFLLGYMSLGLLPLMVIALCSELNYFCLTYWKL